jgi:hypothetical protein
MDDTSSDQHPVRNLLLWCLAIAGFLAVFAVIALASLGGDPVKHW